jgi:hypothetical protein
VGLLVGFAVGAGVGLLVGALVGDPEGISDGAADGGSVGAMTDVSFRPGIDSSKSTKTSSSVGARSAVGVASQ